MKVSCCHFPSVLYDTKNPIFDVEAVYLSFIYRKLFVKCC